MPNCTPLRYPGGKACLRPYLESLIRQNGLADGDYAEPFCGGAGVALELLQGYAVGRIHLNDLDPAVYAFWHSAVHQSDELCALIETTPCTMESWHEQRTIAKAQDTSDLVKLGFSTFFMNRTNRSGILLAGVIGGQQQSGRWKLDARYNRADLLKRLRAIHRFRKHISLYNLDCIDFLMAMNATLNNRSLIYLDPPYVRKGPGLYMNHFTDVDHKLLARFVTTRLRVPWMVSYDDHPLVRQCYGQSCTAELSLPYSAYGNARRGDELVYLSPELCVPEMAPRRGRYISPWAEAA